MMEEEHRVGDKVKIKAGFHEGMRGLIDRRLNDDRVDVTLSTGENINISQLEITNFSLAARRAWEIMPKRAGRPKIEQARKKMVSMRMDIDVCAMLDEAVGRNLVVNKEVAVNTWLRERLTVLLDILPPLDSNIPTAALENENGERTQDV